MEPSPAVEPLPPLWGDSAPAVIDAEDYVSVRLSETLPLIGMSWAEGRTSGELLSLIEEHSSMSASTGS